VRWVAVAVDGPDSVVGLLAQSRPRGLYRRGIVSAS